MIQQIGIFKVNHSINNLSNILKSVTNMNPKELEAWRGKHGLTQEQLANHLGVTKACISRWESGKRSIPAFLHLALKCLKVKKGGGIKKEGTKKKKEVNKK